MTGTILRLNMGDEDGEETPADEEMFQRLAEGEPSAGGEPVEEPAPQPKANFFKCADCEFKAPAENPFMFGRHLHQNGHRHGGMVDEDDNQVRPPPPSKPHSTKPDGDGHKPSKRIYAQIVSPSLKLDTRLILFYDLTRTTFPEYTKSMDEWIFDVIFQYYREHRADFGLEHLFQQELAPA